MKIPVVDQVSHKVTKLLKLIEKVEALTTENQILKKRLGTQANRIERLQQQVEELSLKQQSINSSFEEVKRLQHLSEEIRHLQQQIGNIPLLWLNPTFALSSPLPSVHQLLTEAAQSNEQILHLQNQIELLGSTPQKELLSQLSEAELQTLLENDAYPLPQFNDREGYYENHFLYWLTGLGDYLLLKTLLQAQNLSFQPGFSVLDIGCASGRVLRHFAAHQPVAKVYGSDINRNSIDWIKQNLAPTIMAFQNSVLPQLPLQNNSLDLIYCCSLFTHIASLEEAWLLELHRLLKPDGMAFITVHTERTWDQIDSNHYLYKYLTQIPHWSPSLNLTIINEALFQQPMPVNRIVFEDIQRRINSAQVFHSTEYIQQSWGRIFKVVKIITQAHGIHQDGIVLLKV